MKQELQLKKLERKLNGKRKSEIEKILLDEAKMNYDDLENWSYNNSSDKKKIRKILLLFNIATLVCKGKKQYRFPFNIYKNEAWDIEHIHAIADKTVEEESEEEEIEPDNSFGNLTLLNLKINRSGEYSDKPFNEKRRIILDRETRGLFVPVCTKNIFLKAYTTETTEMNMTIWEEKDKKNYVDEVKNVLNKFFEGEER